MRKKALGKQMVFISNEKVGENSYLFRGRQNRITRLRVTRGTEGYARIWRTPGFTGGFLFFDWMGKGLEPISMQMSSGHLLAAGLDGGNSLIFSNVIKSRLAENIYSVGCLQKRHPFGCLFYFLSRNRSGAMTILITGNRGGRKPQVNVFDDMHYSISVISGWMIKLV